MASKQIIKTKKVKNLVPIKVQLTAFVKKERPGMYVSYCPALDLYSGGDTQKEAKEMIAEAVTLFIEDCFTHGTLKEVLEDCGFHLLQEKSAPKKRKTLSSLFSGGTEISIPTEVPMMAAV